MMALPIKIDWRRLLTSRWLHYALLAAVIALLWMRLGTVAEQRDLWKTAAKLKDKAYAAAAAAAGAEQKALYAARSAREREKARFADERNRIAQDRAERATDGYAERMRIDRLCARQAEPATQDRPAPDRDGPGRAAELVAVTRNDLDILVANSVRLEEVRRWGESLVNEGLAEPLPDPAFGK